MTTLLMRQTAPLTDTPWWIVRLRMTDHGPVMLGPEGPFKTEEEARELIKESE